jgi:ectoine hydroxylase-related dioxygenase (phytanoyl-CoA dioxygenase family)
MADTIPRESASAPPHRINDALRQNGAVIVEDMISKEALARLNDEIDGYLDGAAPERELINPFITGFFGKQTRHITGVASKSRTFVEEVLCHPVYLAACDEILLPSCARYLLNLAHVLDRGPGSEQQLLHRDEQVWSFVPKPHPELQVASVAALVDFTAANGATRAIPGSHLWPADRQPELDELCAAEMPAGSAVLYLGSTIHGGGPNTTKNERRRGMHLSYTLGWLRTEENNYLATPPDIARTLPRQAQELIGYAAHDAIAHGGGYLGTVDTRDPIAMLESGEL